MHNTVTLLDNGLILVQKVGDQTAASLADLFFQIKELAKKLRAENKKVLILSDATQEGTMGLEARQTAAKIGKELDYDRSATFGAKLVVEATRELMIQATQLNAKVRNFETRKEAEDWLLS